MANDKLSQADYYAIDGQLTEIKKQLRNREGYPYDATFLKKHLQMAIEGKFVGSEKPALLEFIQTVEAKGAKEFVARFKFREGKETDGVSIAFLGENFKKNFLSKEEIDVRDVDLRINTLLKYSHDIPIITELGGEEIVETKLAHLWSMLKEQGHGEEGVLLTNGYANIFYIRDTKGVLWAVHPYWNSCCRCHVEAYSVGRQNGWHSDYRVVSRDS